jgi:hypothetical protein
MIVKITTLVLVVSAAGMVALIAVRKMGNVRTRALYPLSRLLVSGFGGGLILAGVYFPWGTWYLGQAAGPACLVLGGQVLLWGVIGWYGLTGDRSTYWKRLGDRAPDDPLQALLGRSLREAKPLLLTLRSRKVYVGFVTYFENRTTGTWIGILPVLSGYRDSETLRVSFTDDYRGVLKKIQGGEIDVSPSDLEIAILADEVVSANIFDTRMYELMDRGSGS